MRGQDLNFITVVKKDKLELILTKKDRWPCLGLRKLILATRIKFVMFIKAIISHQIFDAISLCVIIANSATMVFEDPTTDSQHPVIEFLDDVFLGLYTLEAILKIIGLGFVFGKGTYLRDPWNILDFFIVISAYLAILKISGGFVDISVLRSFRVLRPLRTVSGIEGLRVIVSALLNSLPLLRDTLLILQFFFLIFAIAGV